MRAKLMGLLKDEEGQGMVEYGLIIALVAVVAVVTLVTVGDKLALLFTDISGKI